jgi:sugar transferase (PEP-CTERM/EpsH1 system associated)
MTPKILFLTPDLPYPPHQGAAIRTFNLIKHLAVSYDIHLLSFAPQGNQSDRISVLKAYCADVATAPPPARSTRSRATSLLFSRQPDMALRLPSQHLANQLRICLTHERFDFVQIEALEMAPYGLLAKQLRLGSSPRLIFDDINAEHLLQKRAFESDLRRPNRWLASLYSSIQWLKLRRYEALVCRQMDSVVVVSQADADALHSLVPDLKFTIVPNGVDTAYYSPSKVSTESDATLVFTGKMDFRPNVDAVLWFTQEVWPAIREQVPAARFYVVGRSPHRRLRPLNGVPGITLSGYVEDVRPYMAEAGVYIVPLRVGGGTRLKVLEAMSMGKAIVSTSLGCEGLDIHPGRHLLVADQPQAFAEKVVSLIRDAKGRRELGAAARSLVKSRYDWRDIAPLLEEVYES